MVLQIGSLFVDRGEYIHLTTKGTSVADWETLFFCHYLFHVLDN